ncbi:putative serine esterase-domain-containing protein [Lentinula raphanica]|nr:putative serine esterase-domain-containing protein [Lentinula raphanica]
MTSTTKSIHLLVLLHGMWGHPGHLDEMARIVKETHERDSRDHDELRVLLAETNREEGTYDGIDWCAERVVDEILNEIDAIQHQQETRVTKFSITGYSLGGLVARYVVGILAQKGFLISGDDDNFDQSSSPTPSSYRMESMNFSTIATPHLGLIRYSTLFSSLAHKLGPRLLSRTGEQFYLQDTNTSSGRPLLDIMSDPELPFYRSLTMFKQVRIFANAVNDLTVPYVTAAMEEEDPFVDWEETGLKVEYHPRYRPIITSYIVSSSSPHKSKSKHSKPLIPLPPFLIKPFPFNLFIYALLPLLVPLAFVLVFVRFTRATGRSRLRISRLEKRFAEGKSPSLLQALSDLERQVERRIEDAVVDAIDDPVGSTRTSGTSTPSIRGQMSPSPSPSPSPSSSITLPKPNPNKKPSKNTPLITPLQRIICARLNSLPGLKKEIVFIDESKPIAIRNSHAPIVSRDVRNFKHHRIGEGVLRCWAEGLIM